MPPPSEVKGGALYNQAFTWLVCMTAFFWYMVSEGNLLNMHIGIYHFCYFQSHETSIFKSVDSM